jgi:uroporphyrinogen-III synthase
VNYHPSSKVLVSPICPAEDTERFWICAADARGTPYSARPTTEAGFSGPAGEASGLVLFWRENRLVADGPLRGMTIGVTAERRGIEQSELLQKRGARVLLGPASRVFAYEQDEVLKASTADVVDRPPDFLLASTGFGMRTWLAAAESWGMREALLGALSRARVANRGAKAASVNTAAGLTEWWRAPRERFDELIGRVSSEPLAGRRVVLQVHGVAAPDAVARLADAGAEVIQVDAYRLSLPADPAPAQEIVRAWLRATRSTQR